MMFFDVRDVLGAASDLKLDRTATTNLLLAHSSVFWDTRSVIRTQVLRRTVPHFKELFSLVKPKPTLRPVRNSKPSPLLGFGPCVNCARRTGQN